MKNPSVTFRDFRLLGHRDVDYGDLSKSREIENMPLRLFPLWRSAAGISVTTWLLLFLIDWIRYFSKGLSMIFQMTLNLLPN